MTLTSTSSLSKTSFILLFTLIIVFYFLYATEFSLRGFKVLENNFTFDILIENSSKVENKIIKADKKTTILLKH